MGNDTSTLDNSATENPAQSEPQTERQIESKTDESLRRKRLHPHLRHQFLISGFIREVIRTDSFPSELEFLLRSYCIVYEPFTAYLFNTDCLSEIRVKDERNIDNLGIQVKSDGFTYRIHQTHHYRQKDRAIIRTTREGIASLRPILDEFPSDIKSQIDGDSVRLDKVDNDILDIIWTHFPESEFSVCFQLNAEYPTYKSISVSAWIRRIIGPSFHSKKVQVFHRQRFLCEADEYLSIVIVNRSFKINVFTKKIDELPLVSVKPWNGLFEGSEVFFDCLGRLFDLLGIVNEDRMSVGGTNRMYLVDDVFDRFLDLVGEICGLVAERQNASVTGNVQVVR